MKIFFIKIGIFILISFAIQYAILNAPLDIETSKIERIKDANKYFNIITAEQEYIFVDLFVGEELIFHDIQVDGSALVKWKIEKTMSCKIVYSTDEENPKKLEYNFDIDESPASYFIIFTKDKEFIFETITNLNQ